MRGLATKLEIHHSIIGKIETGDRKLDLFEFIAYCEAIGVDPLKGFRIAIAARSK